MTISDLMAAMKDSRTGIDLDTVTKKMIDLSVGEGELCFDYFRYCAIHTMEDIEIARNAMEHVFDKFHRENADNDAALQGIDSRMEKLSEIYSVFYSICDMPEPVARMVEAAKYHATNSFAQSYVHAIETGLSPYTYRAMTAQRIINWEQ